MPNKCLPRELVSLGCRRCLTQSIYLEGEEKREVRMERGGGDGNGYGRLEEEGG